MSGQNVSLVDGTNPPASHTPPRHGEREPQSHGRAGPESPWCLCGHSREACVSDEVRILWRHLLDPKGQ